MWEAMNDIRRRNLNKYTIIVESRQSSESKEMISIGSAVTQAESCTSDLEEGRVSPEVRTAPVTAIALMQNEPNSVQGSNDDLL
ncbi:MAG: hypothetical protein IPO98_07105 [Saprospiraceae bacterium]|nr:hypothetical protein [Saprospiraceae bacterium]